MKPINYVPHFLCRISGEEINSISEIEFIKTLECLELSEGILRKINSLSADLTKDLHDCISLYKEQSISRVLINLKRDIFNMRFNRVQKYKLENISGFNHDKLNLWLNLAQEYQSTLHLMRETFKMEIQEKRGKLKQLFSNSEYIKAIQVSNTQLYENLLEYLQDNQSHPPKKMRNIEQSLINYLSRMIFKPTPFSSFTGLNYGFFSQEDSSFEINTKESKGHTRINMVYLKKIERMLLNRISIKNKCYVSLNQTINEEENYMFFRRGKDGTSQAFTGEAFIKIKKSELLKELIQYFEGISSMNIVEVVSFLSEKTNYETEALYNYLFKLEKMGVLDFSLGVSEQSDNYTKDLIENLLGIKDSLVEKSVSHLVEIEKIQAIFSESNYQKRYVLLKNLQEHIKKIYSLFDLKLESNDLTSLLFEDVSYKNTKIILNENQWKTHLDDFNLIKNLMPLFDDNILEKLSMNIIFKDIYGNKGAIDLLEFYREFNKYDKNLLWKKIRKNDTYLYLKKLRTEFYDYLETQINMGLDTIFLNKSWLKKFINKFPDLLK
ncbi:lantibiotic dehydratase, partial [Bacillus cereus]